MKNILVSWLLLLLLMSCSSSVRDVEKVDLAITGELILEMFIPEEVHLSMVYDICAKNEHLYCLDFYNDTILKVYNAQIPPSLIGYTLKGGGPEEFSFPFFETTLPNSEGDIRVMDLNRWCVKRLVGDSGQVKAEKIMNLPAIPAIQNYNETESAIYGNDIEFSEGAFLRYDKVTKTSQGMGECLTEAEIPDIYTLDELSLLKRNIIGVNEQADVVCVAMQYVNLLCLYSLDGELKKRIMLGDECIFPERDKEYLDFPQAKKQIVSMTGTKDYLYCLYNGSIEDNDGSLILQLDWDGNLRGVWKTGVVLEKISITPNGLYIYGTHVAESGGSDVYRFPVI